MGTVLSFAPSRAEHWYGAEHCPAQLGSNIAQSKAEHRYGTGHHPVQDQALPSMGLSIRVGLTIAWLRLSTTPCGAALCRGWWSQQPGWGPTGPRETQPLAGRRNTRPEARGQASRSRGEEEQHPSPGRERGNRSPPPAATGDTPAARGPSESQTLRAGSKPQGRDQLPQGLGRGTSLGTQWYPAAHPSSFSKYSFMIYKVL